MAIIEQIAAYAIIAVSASRGAFKGEMQLRCSHGLAIYSLLAKQAHDSRHAIPVDLSACLAVTCKEEQRLKPLVMQYAIPYLAHVYII